MSARFYSDEYMYWTKATVGLQRTKEGLYTFLKLKMQTFIAQFQSDDDHFTRFLESMMDRNCVICRYTRKHTKEVPWTYFSNCDSSRCELCEDMFHKILEIHTRKKSVKLNWIVHDTARIKPQIHWWIVAKFYIPNINDKIKRSTGPDEVDVLTLLELLINCTLFENIKYLAMEVIEVRNTLMHTNETSKAEMKESFSKMKALLGEEHVKETSYDQLRILEELYQTDIYLIKAKRDDYEMIAKTLKLKKKAIKHDMSATRNAARTTTELEEFKRLNELKELEGMLTETNEAICTEKRSMNKEYSSKKEEFERLSREKELSDLEKIPHVKSTGAVPDEINYEPYKLLLYNKAIRKGKETERVLRINIIGNYKQGKTSLARSLIGQSSEGVTATNGIDINRYTFKRSKDGSFSANQCENDNLDIMNRVATVARSIPVAANTSHRRDIEITTVSENKPLNTDTEQSTHKSKEDTVVQSIPKKQPKKEDSVVQLLYERQPKKEDSVEQTMYEIKSEKKLPISTKEYETFSDAMEKGGDISEQLLDIWDFGGQYIFYVTHTLFHCKNALYLLVFDLTSPLDKIVRDENFPKETGDKDMASFAKFWVESIDAYTGPETQVVLIGTHKDEIVNSDRLKDGNPENWKEDYFEKVRSLFDGTHENQLIHHIQQDDFAVDNSNSTESGIRELLAYILEKHQELVQTVEIPARWIQLEKALNDERGKKVVTFQDVMNIDKTIKFPLDDEEQVKLFLSYHHDKGRLFFFDDGQPSDPIVLDPKLLIDTFKCIITSEKFVKNPDVRVEWSKLKDEGILTEKLIDVVWYRGEFKQHKDVLLKFLSKHCILSQVMGCQSGKGNKEQTTFYVVPSMLRDSKHATDKLKLFLSKKSQTQIRYVLKLIRPSVVQMVFHRITAAMLGTWQVVNCDNTKLHFENLCVLKIPETTQSKSANHAAIIECIPKFGSIELRLVHLDSGEVRFGVADQLRRYVESFVMTEFRKLKCSNRDGEKPYSRGYRCNHKDHPAYSGSIAIEELSENENEIIRCPDNRTHENDFFRNAKEVWFIGNKAQADYPNLQLTERHLSFLSQAFGKNWQLLGPALGIKETEMDHINDDHKTTSLKIYHMLLKWKNSVTAEKATLNALVDVVKNYPRVTVGWDEFRNL